MLFMNSKSADDKTLWCLHNIILNSFIVVRLYVLEICHFRYFHRLSLYHSHFSFFHSTRRMNNAFFYFYVFLSFYVFIIFSVFSSSFLFFFFCFVLCFFFFQFELLIFTLISLSQSTTMIVKGWSLIRAIYKIRTS